MEKSFLKHCRRSTGSDRLVQVARFDEFIEASIQIRIRDVKTKELLITPKTKLKIEATRLAIASGYYTDPAGVLMCTATLVSLDPNDNQH
jgi:hypothetical protein